MVKVSFCGISGSGMSALAQVLKAKGYEVCGSDRSFDQGKDEEQKKALQEVGINIFPQNGEAIDGKTSCLYVSSAVEDSIPDVKKALELNIPIRKRSDLLAQIFNEYNYPIAVGGTSGKTTVTAMIGFILDKLGKKPTVINGGLLKNYLSVPGIANVILNQGDICVAEADESDGSIEKYTPYIALINNISIDHKPLDELKKLFFDFAHKAQAGAVVNLDCPNSGELLTSNARIVTFSLQNPTADIFITDIKPLSGGVSYNLDGKTFTLKIPGAFNAGNAAAAIAACSLLGINRLEAAVVLQEFLGTKRRLDVIGQKNGITVIDDFAHNPDKVAASLSALRDYPGRLLIMFQPHGFSPMRMMGREIMDSFARGMQKDDILFVPEIYYAGGTVKRDISSKDLADYACSKGVDAVFCENREEVKKKILATVCSGDRIVVMGARDNSLPLFCEELLANIAMPMLQKGDAVALVAPSNFIETADLDKVLKWFKRNFGVSVQVMPHILSRYRYMAGTAAERAQDINTCFANAEIKAVFCVRGGAGSAQILDKLDYDLIKNNPKPVFGLSDSTALQNALYTMTGNVSYSGFLPVYDLKNECLDVNVEKCLNRIFSGKGYAVQNGKKLKAGHATGISVGGCLSVLCQLCGTKYFPDLTDKILFLEDIGEKTYKIELWLNQLRMQPGFDKLKGIIFGQFKNCLPADPEDGTINEILQDFVSDLNIPVICDFSYGHEYSRVVLPIGGKVYIEAEEEVWVTFDLENQVP